MQVQAQKRFGVKLHILEETPEGDVNIPHLKSLLKDAEGPGDPGLTVVSISHIPTSSGRVYNAQVVGAAVAEHPGVFRRPLYLFISLCLSLSLSLSLSLVLVESRY
jgi:aspartate aminotransferase-like enzyme